MLSSKYKTPGYILILLGTALSVFYFVFKLRFELPVFAFVSSFMETRFLSFFKTNFADELILLLLLIGFTLIVFSKEKKELDCFNKLRVDALIKAILTDIIILIFAVLFIYGSGFIAIIILNIFLPFILYLIFFNLLKHKTTGKNISFR